MVRRERGFSLIEISVTLALFGLFLLIIAVLTAEMRRSERRFPINFMTHPDVGVVVARLRRDVYDSKYFPDAWQTYTQSDETPILYPYFYYFLTGTKKNVGNVEVSAMGHYDIAKAGFTSAA